MSYLEDSNQVSCGMRELINLQVVTSPKEHIETVVQYAYEEDYGNKPKFSQVLFSDANKHGHGKALARYIREHKLGDIIETKSIRNRNSRNYIKSWIWNIRSFRKLKEHVGYTPTKEVW